MKRYLVFAGLRYYPTGGWADYCGCFDTLEEAVTAADALLLGDENWAEVVDSQTEAVVYNKHD